MLLPCKHSSVADETLFKLHYTAPSSVSIGIKRSDSKAVAGCPYITQKTNPHMQQTERFRNVTPTAPKLYNKATVLLLLLNR